MKARSVVLSPEAQDDLRGIEELISHAGSPGNAMRYVERIAAFCKSLETASERGTKRVGDVRVIGFGKRVTIAFVVEADAVLILRIFYGGADWESEL